MPPVPVVRLETPRLALRPPVRSDAGDIARLAGDFDVASRLAAVPHPYAAEDAAFFLTEIAPRHSVWAVEAQAAGAFLGVIGLKPLDADGVAELGYWYGKPYWGRGYATEAGRAIIDHAFGAGRLASLKSGHFADNPASGRVLEKLGFRVTGRGKVHCLARGRDVDHVDMALERFPTKWIPVGRQKTRQNKNLERRSDSD